MGSRWGRRKEEKQRDCHYPLALDHLPDESVGELQSDIAFAGPRHRILSPTT